MKTQRLPTPLARQLPFILFMFLTLNVPAATRYVWQESPTPTPPYTSWATAATNIQDAVDAAVAGDEIVVTNGTYATGGRAVSGTTHRVAVDKPLNVRSVNGPQSTTIDGNSSNRCVYLTNGASLSGFTLTHGRAHSGGGLWCESTNAAVSNCVVSGNSASGWIRGCCVETAFAGGVYRGTLSNCILSDNRAEAYHYCGFDCDYSTCRTVSGPYVCDDFLGSGGGAYNSTLNHCTLTGNSAGYGGGTFACTLNNCTLSDNSARDGGGAAGGTLNNCTLSGNSAVYGGGASGGTLNNCTLTGNSAYYDGGGAIGGTLNNCTLTGNLAAYGGGASGGTLNNCTLTGNSAADIGGGASAYYSSDGDGGTYLVPITLNNCTLAGNSATNSGGGAYEGALNNCVVYFNTAPQGANYDSSSTLNYSCTTPLPTNGVGNITNAPLFVDTNGWSNLRLQSNSPCINAGLNAFAPAGFDLDGNPRIMGGTVDMGAYEFPMITLVNAAKLPGGAFQFAFNAGPNGAYTVLATTDLSLPLAKWTALALVPEFSPGLYVFSDPQAANRLQMFYLVVEGNYYRQRDPGCPPYPYWCCPDAYICIHPSGGPPYWSGNANCPCAP